MKLRQKLAAVLAATMIVTAIPVTTMAATAVINNTVSAVEGTQVGYEIAKVTTGAAYEKGARTEVSLKEHGTALNIKLDGYEVGQKTVFYLNAEAAEFSKEAFIAKAMNAVTVYFDEKGNLVEAGVPWNGETVKPEYTISQNGMVAKLTYLSKEQIRVELDATAATDKNIILPMYLQAKKGTPAIVIDGRGSFVESGKVLISDEITNDKVLSVKFDETVSVIPVEGYGELGKITLTENLKGVLNSEKEEDRTITIKLPNSSDLEFDRKQTITLKGGRALAGQTLTAKATVDEKDAKLLTLVFDKTGISDSTGYVEITGLDIKPEDARVDAKLGSVEVTVKGKSVADTTGVVAEVKDYGINLKAEEVISLVAGKEGKEVTLTLQEAAGNSLNKRHDVYFELDNADVVKDSVKLVEDDKNTKVEIKEDIDKEGNVRGFFLDLDTIKEDKANRIQIKFEVEAELDATGEVKVIAESRSFEKDLETKIADVTAPVTIKTEPVTVKVGLNAQDGGSITLTETDKEMIQKGQLVLAFEQEGIKFANKDLKIETDGTLEVKVDKIKDNTISLEVKRTSKEPATLKISGFTLNVDRTVPQGDVEVLVGGSALAEKNTSEKPLTQTIEVENFIKVGTLNTEDAGNSTQKAVTATFKIGETKFKVNEEEKTMDAAPYVSSRNRMMMPVRYVAEAFGIAGNDIMFSDTNGGTITIFAGNRVVQLKNNSDTALLNGVSVKMDEKVAIKEGRTYVPVGEVAKLLGVKSTWDNTTKTATFTNK